MTASFSHTTQLKKEKGTKVKLNLKSRCSEALALCTHTCPRLWTGGRGVPS